MCTIEVQCILDAWSALPEAYALRVLLVICKIAPEDQHNRVSFLTSAEIHFRGRLSTPLGAIYRPVFVYMLHDVNMCSNGQCGCDTWKCCRFYWRWNSSTVIHAFRHH